MSGIMRIGLSLVGTTRYIPKNNTPKYLRAMCHVKNGFNHITKNSIISAPKESAGYLKIISAFTKKTLWYSTIPLSIIVGYCTYLVKMNPRFWEDWDMLTAVNNETLKYSIIPSKIITSSVLFDDGEIRIKTRENNINLMNDNTRNLILSEELDANVQEPFPKGKPILITIGKFTGLLDNGKLTLKTEDGDTLFTFHHTLSLEVKKTSTTLQNEIVAEKKEQPATILKKDGKFNLTYSGFKTTLKTPTSEKKWANMQHSDDNLFLQLYHGCSFSYEDSLKIQENKSDEVYYFKQSVNIELNKKLDKNLQIVAEKKNPRDIQEVTMKVSPKDILVQEIKTCDVSIDSGTVVFKTQDGDKFIVRHVINVQVFEDGGNIYLYWLPLLTEFPFVPSFTF